MGRRELGKKILDTENLKAVVYYERKGQAMTRYKNQILQDTYTKAMSTARAGGVDLFAEGGRVRRIGSMAVAFWNGYEEKPRGPMEPQGSMASAMFAAGRDFKREQPARKVKP